MVGLLGRVVVSERGVTLLETADNGGEDLLERMGARFTLGDILAAVLQDSVRGDNVLHVHISTPCRQLDRVEAVDHPVIPSCEESWLILSDNSCLWLQRFGVTKATLLLAMLNAEAVGS